MDKEEELLYCQWCGEVVIGKHYALELEVGLDKSLRNETSFRVIIDFDKKEFLLGFIIGKDAPPDIEDADLLFICCSAGCAESLKREVMKEERLLGILSGLMEGIYFVD